MEIVWSQSAVRKVEEISKFIAKDSPLAASRFIDRLIKSVEHLRKFPLSGPAISENIAFRQVVFKGYRIIYRLTSETVQIVTIISPGFGSPKVIKK